VAGRSGRTDAAVEYAERLTMPWWWYPIGAGVAAILAAEFHLADRSITDWLPYTILVPLTLGIVWSLGRSRVQVGGSEFTARDAHLPLSAVSGVVALDAVTLRRVVGREGDPSAFVMIRPWIGPGIQLWLDDPDDPTPYWVVSTRHPAQLVAVIRDHLAPG
jgi:hypothetical protein